MLRVLIAVLLAIMSAVGTVQADGPASPSAAQLREALDASTDAIEAARQSPSTTDADQSLAGALDASQLDQGTGTMPRFDMAATASADVRALIERARTGAVLGTRSQLASSREARPIVFVSFSLPESSLRALVEQSRVLGAALVLRGLVDDSMQHTVERLGELLGVDAEVPSASPLGSDLNLMIDPTLFERFAVNAVPSFVLPLEAPAACEAASPCVTPEHVKLAGNVSLAYALELMSREASDPGVRVAAAGWARRMQGAE